jgi:hypothetical protein
MRSKTFFACAVVAAGSLAAQTLDPANTIRIQFPADSPLVLVSRDLGESRATPRGGAMVIDLHAALTLRNVSQNRVRGVTLLVLAQDVTPGGKASVATPSLNAGPGETFPVRIDLRLLRPLAASTAGQLVQVDLDGVLFQDLSFYGPNLLNSRRAMTVWEAEAERDRRHFKSVLEAAGPDGLQREVLDSLSRQASRPRLDVQVSRGRATAAAGPEQVAQFSFLKFPDSPVEPLDGAARIAGSEARAPRIQVRNRSPKAVSYFEIGWIVRDAQGKEYLAASVPASDPELRLAPGRESQALQNASLRFSRSGGGGVAISGVTGFVSQVEYADGKVWVPSRSELGNAQLLRVLAPSPEEQRLTDLYRRKGLAALAAELKKF